MPTVVVGSAPAAHARVVGKSSRVVINLSRKKGLPETWSGTGEEGHHVVERGGERG